MPQNCFHRLWRRGRPGGRSRRHYVGIDIGVDTVRVAALTRPGNQQPLTWSLADEFSLPIEPSGEPPADWVERIVGRLWERLPRCVEDGNYRTTLSLPVPWIHYETVLKPEREARQQHCHAMFGESLFCSQANVKLWPIAPGSDHEVLAATAESSSLEIAETVAQLGYDVCAILPHGAALAKASAWLTSIHSPCIALLEPTGGLAAINRIPSPSQIQQGELTGTCGLCRSLPACEELTTSPLESMLAIDVEPWIDEIARQIKATIRFANRNGTGADDSDPILICGSAAVLPGLDQALAARLERPVATWTYTGQFRSDVANHASRQNADDPASDDACYGVALSLACCAAIGERLEAGR